jgi:hypothetical protein
MYSYIQAHSDDDDDGGGDDDDDDGVCVCVCVCVCCVCVCVFFFNLQGLCCKLRRQTRQKHVCWQEKKLCNRYSDIINFVIRNIKIG